MERQEIVGRINNILKSLDQSKQEPIMKVLIYYRDRIAEETDSDTLVKQLVLYELPLCIATTKAPLSRDTFKELKHLLPVSTTTYVFKPTSKSPYHSDFTHAGHSYN